MDVTKMLEADHGGAKALFDRIDKTDGADRQPMIDELVITLRGHMQLEEQVLYPKMAPVTGDEAVQEANKEHELARKGLEDLVSLAPDEPGFGAALAAVNAGIEHHVEEEETEVFPALRKDGAVLEEIATPFMRTRSELGLPMTASALAAASTKDELLAEASSAGIETTSSMTKNELAGALAAKMS
jgi:Hemerythrin HHE cation binding domain